MRGWVYFPLCIIGFVKTGFTNMLFTLLQTEMSYSFFEMAAKGGPLMIVLLILSIIAIYIFGKKMVGNTPRRKD